MRKLEVPFPTIMSTSNSRRADPARSSAVQAEIRQKRPFRSPAQEATIALLRTASIVSRGIARVVEPSGLSLAQYNALRIIRGAGAGGIPTLAIRERMVEEGTTITRLLDKLEGAGLIRRERSSPDRRQVICEATDAGKKLLDRLDPLTDSADEEAMTALSPSEIEEFIALLDTVRAANAERGAPRTAATGRDDRGAAPGVRSGRASRVTAGTRRSTRSGVRARDPER